MSYAPPFDIDAALADGTFEQRLEDWFEEEKFRAQERRAQRINDAQQEFAKVMDDLQKRRDKLAEDARERGPVRQPEDSA